MSRKEEIDVKQGNYKVSSVAGANERYVACTLDFTFETFFDRKYVLLDVIQSVANGDRVCVDFVEKIANGTNVGFAT